MLFETKDFLLNSQDGLMLCFMVCVY